MDHKLVPFAIQICSGNHMKQRRFIDIWGTMSAEVFDIVTNGSNIFISVARLLNLGSV